MNIVVVAGGLGTRFKELSVFPKVLLPINDYNSILEKDLKTINEDDKFYLIINEKFYDMTLNYITVNNLTSKVTIIPTSNTNGSYNSIKSVEKDLPKNNVLFIWSDIVLDKIPEFDENNECIIFTYENQGYRYRYDDTEGIRLAYNYLGNIPGVYYIKNLEDVLLYNVDSFNDFDLIDAINGSKMNITGIQLDNLFEYRDYNTYANKIKEVSDVSLKTRFFNKMTIEEDGTLKKQAIDPNYFPIIEKEFHWYEFGYANVQDFSRIVPRIDLDSFKDNSFKMEYLKDYKPLHIVIKEKDNVEDVIKIYQNIKDCIEILSKNSIEIERADFARDLKKEIVDKVLERCDKIQYMLINYNREYLANILDKVYRYLLSLETGDKVKYYFGHGDLNGSNIMVNPNTLEVKFIDPRGYFGYTTKYIWREYEYSKLLYCLNGYDDFNNLAQIYKRDIPQRLKWYDKIDYLDETKYRVLVGIIYIALAGYISQDIIKANIAYEYGISLLNEEGF